MPNCCIIGCGMQKSKNRPDISLHRLPRNEIKMRTWLDVIGHENINLSRKTIVVCSLHFMESCFNRTLNITTLRDDAIPSRILLPPRRSSTPRIFVKKIYNLPSSQPDMPSPVISTSSISSAKVLNQHSSAINIDSNKMLKLMEKCAKQNKKIKILNQEVRRLKARLVNFTNIIKDLKSRNNIDTESSTIVLEELEERTDWKCVVKCEESGVKTVTCDV